MNLADNINNMVFTGKRNIKYRGKNIIYCLRIDWQIFLFADKINKLQKKKDVCKSWQPAINWKNRGWRGYSYIRMGLEKNIRSVILDWRQKPAGHSSRPVSFPCVFSSCHTTSQKGSPPQKKDMCELSLTAFQLHTIVAVEE